VTQTLYTLRISHNGAAAPICFKNGQKKRLFDAIRHDLKYLSKAPK
jgi:hypothetical protein